MRQIGSLKSEAKARKFASYLLTLGIKSHIDPEDSVWEIWVRDEDQIAQANAELEKFVANPEATIYQDVEAKAEKIMEEEIEQARKASQNVVEMRGQWKSPMQSRRRPLTIALIVICLIVALFSGTLGGGGLNSESVAYRALVFSGNARNVKFKDQNVPLSTRMELSFESIRKGELWRAITPIFLHGDLWHILFNLFALHYLGSQVENAYGTWKFALMVLGFALIPNFLQAIAVGPNFVGISGVCFGLFGFAWIKGMLEPDRGIYIGELTVIIVLAWFVMGYLGYIPNMANWAHGGGLFSGIFLAFLPHLVKAQNRQKK